MPSSTTNPANQLADLKHAADEVIRIASSKEFLAATSALHSQTEKDAAKRDIKSYLQKHNVHLPKDIEPKAKIEPQAKIECISLCFKRGNVKLFCLHYELGSGPEAGFGFGDC
jgi:hypothetical protein